MQILNDILSMWDQSNTRASYEELFLKYDLEEMIGVLVAEVERLQKDKERLNCLERYMALRMIWHSHCPFEVTFLGGTGTATEIGWQPLRYELDALRHFDARAQEDKAGE